MTYVKKTKQKPHLCLGTFTLQQISRIRTLCVRNIVERRQRSKAHFDKRTWKLRGEIPDGEKVVVKPNRRNKHKAWTHSETISVFNEHLL